MNFRQKMMKTFYPAVKTISNATGKFSNKTEEDKSSIVSFWNLSFNNLAGEPITMSDHEGKNILIVNTASSCGFTGQLKDLQLLQEQHKNNLVVIGFPSNDFKDQEQLSNEELGDFCEKNYGVQFSLTEKCHVLKTPNQHPVFKWLTDKEKNGWNDKAPGWNFTKYLVNAEGNLKGVYEAGVSPLDLKI